MKKGNSLFNRLTWYVFFAVMLSVTISCTDKLQEEIDALKASKTELESQINLDGSTISELEAQKAALEAQKSEVEAENESLNELIVKLDRMIASRYVERYLSTIFGTENHRTYRWQHLYNEDMQLAISYYFVTSENDFDAYDILQGKSSNPVRSEITHHYEDGVLIKSESDTYELVWVFVDGKITEFTMQIIENNLTNTIYTINAENGNILKRASHNASGNSTVWTYAYNENNLVVEIERATTVESTSYDFYEYDDNFNMVKYSSIWKGSPYEEKIWVYNEDGNITRFVEKGFYQGAIDGIDSIEVTYNIDGTKEVYFERVEFECTWCYELHISKFNADHKLIYNYVQLGEDDPRESEYEYADGYKTKISNIYYTKNSLGEKINDYTRIERYTRDDLGTITSKEKEEISYDENGLFSYGSLYAYKNIIWSPSGYDMLKYTMEYYDYDSKQIINKSDYEFIESEDKRIFEKKYADYHVEGGTAMYISYNREITEFFTESPFAPKVKVEKQFNLSGEISSSTYVNDMNDINKIDWVLL